MRIQPLHANLLVRPILKGDLSRGGLIMPTIAAKNAPFRYADVVETGTGRVNAEGKTIPLTVKAGDVVAFAKGAGLELPIETDTGEEILLLLEERYVLGIVHGLKRPTAILGLDGHLLDMEPQSRGRPDVVYKNQDELDRQAKDWPEFGTTTDHVDEPEPDQVD